MGEQHFWCPYLNAEVALTDEREAHIRAGPPKALELGIALLVRVLSAPALVMERDGGTTLLARREPAYNNRWVVLAVRAAPLLSDPDKVFVRTLTEEGRYDLPLLAHFLPSPEIVFEPDMPKPARAS